MRQWRRRDAESSAAPELVGGGPRRFVADKDRAFKDIGRVCASIGVMGPPPSLGCLSMLGRRSSDESEGANSAGLRSLSGLGSIGRGEEGEARSAADKSAKDFDSWPPTIEALRGMFEGRRELSEELGRWDSTICPVIEWRANAGGGMAADGPGREFCLAGNDALRLWACQRIRAASSGSRIDGG